MSALEREEVMSIRLLVSLMTRLDTERNMFVDTRNWFCSHPDLDLRNFDFDHAVEMRVPSF